MTEQYPNYEEVELTQQAAHWHPAEFVPRDEITPRYKALLANSSRMLLERSHFEQLSEQNHVTGLDNRRVFDRTLIELIGQAEDGGKQDFAVAFIDLDGFKAINDEHGHAMGDEVLRRMGMELQELVRPGDKVVHFSGDEFAIVMPQIDFRENETAELSPEELSKLMELRFATAAEVAAHKAGEIAGKTGVIGSASVGIAFYRPGDTPESLTVKADQAMYRNKKNKKDRLANAR